MKLTWTHSVIMRNRNGNLTTQVMDVCVDYDPSEDSLDDIEVWIYQDGKRLAEVSYLLSKAEGDPLSEMIAAIDWRELWADEKYERKRYECADC